ncbi:MAG: helix-turn-helix domain-containing protein [bacterium]|nr:helix-turn-helix domain-containing protein [bacterium]
MMDYDLKAFGLRIKAIRKALGLTQTQLATSIGKSKSIVSEVEKGKSKAAVDFIGYMLRNHNVESDYLFWGEGRMFRKKEVSPKHTGRPIGSPLMNWDELLWYIENSKMVNNSVFGFAAKLVHDNVAYIKKELAAMAEAEKE